MKSNRRYWPGDSLYKNRDHNRVCYLNERREQLVDWGEVVDEMAPLNIVPKKTGWVVHGLEEQAKVITSKI